MRLSTQLRSSVAILFALGFVSHANATAFSIDEFTITRNGALFFQDTFDNGDPYNTGFVYSNGNIATYDTSVPLNATEQDGRLIIDPYASALVPSSLTGEPLYLQQARLISNTSNNLTDLNRGLKVDDYFTVTGVFDLITPTVDRERFGIRLTDRGTANGTGDDTVEVDLRLLGSDMYVEFREQNVATSTHTTLDRFLLSAEMLGLTDAEFSLFDQIVLNLERPDANADIFGSFTLLDLDGVLSSFSYMFNGSSSIFEGELFTRAEFISVGLPASVPEPGTAALFGLGLLMLGFNQHRKKS